ncbi:uncharacterized protein VTP21DRAFT_833 [Calcarisporiella thermophila]|uniref:uncharacterized protein n=1 Tax=Calcarisporiella thermophila TaxID=911321 RepID=UPI003743A96F
MFEFARKLFGRTSPDSPIPSNIGLPISISVTDYSSQPGSESSGASAAKLNNLPSSESELKSTDSGEISSTLQQKNGRGSPSYSSKRVLPEDLANDINQFRIDGFAKKYFSTHKKGIFRRRVPVEEMLLWTREPISKPLMVINRDLHRDALKCFKLVLRIMGDRIHRSKQTEDIQELLSYGILHGELRDEIYVQICKQLTNNPSASSRHKGWELLCVVTVAFPPSKNFEAYLKNFIAQHFDSKDEQIVIMARHVFNRLQRICIRGPRGKVLTFAEIQNAREAPFHPSIFGESLEFIMNLQSQTYPDLKIPRILPFLAQCILDLDGCKSEGIFRVPGDADLVTDLRLRIEKGEYVLANLNDPNVPASLLKLWLRDLSDPLIPTEYYDACIRSAEDVAAALDLINRLPTINRRVAQYMINFLQVFARPDTIRATKMNVHNLAMVFAPNFLRCPTDNLAVIFENTKYEQAFLRTLILNLQPEHVDIDAEGCSIPEGQPGGLLSRVAASSYEEKEEHVETQVEHTTHNDSGSGSKIDEETVKARDEINTTEKNQIFGSNKEEIPEEPTSIPVDRCLGDKEEISEPPLSPSSVPANIESQQYNYPNLDEKTEVLPNSMGGQSFPQEVQGPADLNKPAGASALPSQENGGSPLAKSME